MAGVFLWCQTLTENCLREGGFSRLLKQAHTTYEHMSLERYFTFYCAGLKDTAHNDSLHIATKLLRKRNYITGSQNAALLVSGTGDFFSINSGNEQLPALSWLLSYGLQPRLPPSPAILSCLLLAGSQKHVDPVISW